MEPNSPFIQRRERLWSQLADNSILIIAGAKQVLRNRDVEYPFRQNSDFYYLTGFEEPDAVLVLRPLGDAYQYVLFNQVRDLDREVWNGPRAGQAGAVADFGADVAYPIEKLDEKILEWLADVERVYYSFTDKTHLSEEVLRWSQHMTSNPRIDSPVHEFINVDPVLHEMRLLKSALEIEQMRRAADITVAAHLRAMRAVQPGLFEYQLEADILHEFMQAGIRQPAYGTIVGGGANACVLHYVTNIDQLRAGDLVLIDAGAEYNNYAADVTRTFPVSGTFSEEQKNIYNIVLKAQLTVIDAIKPGLKWNILQEIATQTITEGLVELGILTGDVDELISSKKVNQFYMHGVSHWLGLDVHDVGDYKINDQWRDIQENMTFTVEPGIYIAADNRVDEKWWNIGVRIEDDIVVTDNGCDVLTEQLPKTVAEIEALMASR